MDSKSTAAAILKAHAASIDDLHRQLAALPGVSKDRLANAVVKYKAAFDAFEDDAQGNVVIGGGDHD